MNKVTTRKANNTKYQVGKHDNVQWCGNPVINHSVEQVLRAVLLGDDVESCIKFRNVFSKGNTFTKLQEPDSHVVVGIADVRGWRLSPVTNSYLIRSGIKPDAFLLRLSQQHIDGVQLLREQDGKLYILFSALYQTAYEAVQRPERILNGFNGYVRKHGYPKHFFVNGKYTPQDKPVIVGVTA